MTGKHRIIVQSKRLKYDFQIRRNLTVIRGNSATGKNNFSQYDTGLLKDLRSRQYFMIQVNILKAKSILVGNDILLLF